MPFGLFLSVVAYVWLDWPYNHMSDDFVDAEQQTKLRIAVVSLFCLPMKIIILTENMSCSLSLKSLLNIIRHFVYSETVHRATQAHVYCTQKFKQWKKKKKKFSSGWVRFCLFLSWMQHGLIPVDQVLTGTLLMAISAVFSHNHTAYDRQTH